MKESEWLENLIQIIEAEMLPQDVILAEASTAFEMAQERALLNAAGPFERVLRYLREDIVPVLRHHERHFESLVEDGIATAAIRLKIAKDELLSTTVIVGKDCRAYIERMLGEGLAGPQTARVVIVLGTLDALKKMGDQGFLEGYTALSYTDLLMITLVYLRFKEDLFPRH